MNSDREKSDGKSRRTEVTIALITLVGVLGGALFANWDKVFPPRGTEPPHVATPPASLPTPSSPDTQPPAAFVERFVGRWENENPDTSGITRVRIDSRLNKIIINMWGSCHPNDCDWGSQSIGQTDSDDGLLSVTWTNSFNVIDQQITVLPDDRLRVSGHTRFTDNSGRPDYNSTYYFLRR